MIVFPNCKINLGLRIIRKREDNYHDLETIFYPLPCYDILEIIHAEDDTSFTSSGSAIEGDPNNNLCLKAYTLLKKDFSSLPAIKMHLHKAIPTGAGLGGGSADAAFTLKLLNEKFLLGLSTDQLINYSLQLGSDCPFFIINKPAFATGRGEILEQINLDLSSYKFIIINPGIHISTAQAFSGIIPALPSTSLKKTIQQPIESWKDELVNDFEKNIFTQYPEIAAIKQQLYNSGALYTAMSGTGSTVFGIFKKETAINFQLPPHYFIKELNG